MHDKQDNRTPANENLRNNQFSQADLMHLAQTVNMLGTWEWDLQSKKLLWTDAMFQIRALPVSVDHYISVEDMLDFVHPDDRTFLKESLSLLYEKKNVEFEYRIVDTNKNVKVVKAWAEMYKDEQGRPTYIRGTSQDVTRLKEVERELRQINQAFEQSEDLANLGNWQYNLATAKYTYSDNLYRILNVKPEQLQNSATGFMKFVHADDVQKLYTTADFIKHPNQPLKAEYRIVTDGGKERYVRNISKLIVNADGEKIILGTFQDISNEVALRNQMEEKATLNEILIENSVDIVAAFDTEMHIIAWNKQCEQKYRFKKEDVLGKHVKDVIPYINQQLFKDISTALDGQFVHREQGVDLSDGEFMEYYVLPLTKKGEIFGALSIAHDLTAIKHVTDKLVDLNQSLKLKNEELERSNNELASFSYVASHDLQEPLRKIKTFSNRLVEKEFENLSEQGKEYLLRMESAALRMQKLIEDLLTFSRTNTSAKDFDEIDLNEMVDDIVKELKEVIEEKHAVIKTTNLPVTKIISFQFRQLLENLLINALKYSKPGICPLILVNGSVVTGAQIGGETALDTDQYYKITFEDNGIGFDQQFEKKIFELFQRLHGRSEYPGTGLGLAICKSVVQNHNGFITAKGEVDVGSIFTVYLPVK